MLVAAVVGALACAIGLLLFFAKMSYDYVRQLDFRTAELENEARRRLESEATLVQAQKMEAVGQLTGGIAHDFNNMLTVIIGNLETLQRRLKHMQSEGESGDKLAVLIKPAELALQGARNAAKLTHRLLAFARRQPLAPVQLDLNKVVSGMSELLRRTVGEPIVFETVLGAGLWRTFVDANQLENVLLNLVVNARDAMPNGGHLTIETANAYLDEAYARAIRRCRRRPVRAAERDRHRHRHDPGAAGAGVRAVLHHQGRPAGLRPRPGDGAWLRQAVRRSCPDLQRSSTRARRSKSICRGSRRSEAAANPEELPQRDARVETAAHRSETVLVVEDNDERPQLRARRRSKNSATPCCWRATRAEALQITANGARIDLLFTDVVLPGEMNGRLLSQKILEERPNLPVLFTTGYTPNAIVHHGRLDPDVQLLSKPYTQSDLSRKIRAMLDR